MAFFCVYFKELNCYRKFKLLLNTLPEASCGALPATRLIGIQVLSILYFPGIPLKIKTTCRIVQQGFFLEGR